MKNIGAENQEQLIASEDAVKPAKFFLDERWLIRTPQGAGKRPRLKRIIEHQIVDASNTGAIEALGVNPTSIEDGVFGIVSMQMRLALPQQWFQVRRAREEEGSGMVARVTFEEDCPNKLFWLGDAIMLEVNLWPITIRALFPSSPVSGEDEFHKLIREMRRDHPRCYRYSTVIMRQFLMQGMNVSPHKGKHGIAQHEKIDFRMGLGGGEISSASTSSPNVIDVRSQQPLVLVAHQNRLIAGMLLGEECPLTEEFAILVEAKGPTEDSDSDDPLPEWAAA